MGDIYKRHGYIAVDTDRLHGRELGIAVAEGMMELGRRVGFPATLAEIPGFTDEHIERAVAAAKNPQLEMKLKNMPVPMQAGDVDTYMAPLLRAAARGDLSLIKEM